MYANSKTPKMKQNRTFCIDQELVDKLKREDNQSDIVNQALKKHYLDELTPEELESQKKEVEAQIAQLQKKNEKIDKELSRYKNSKLKGTIVRHT